MARADRPRRRRLVLAGGILGVALSPPLASLRRSLAARALRVRGPGADPVAPFREAPCHRQAADRAAAEPPAREHAR